MTENDFKHLFDSLLYSLKIHIIPCVPFYIWIFLVCEMLKSKSICCGNRNADFLFEYAIKVNVDYIEHYVVFYSLKKGKVVATLLCSSKIAEPMKFSHRWWFKYWICGGIVL